MSINTENKSESNSVDIYKIIEAGDITGVRNFIVSGADINKIHKKSGWTPLEIATYQGKLEIAEILVAAGAIIDKPSLESLDLAARKGFTKIVNLLLQAGNYTDKSNHNKRFYDAIFSSIIYGHIETVKAFITAGADVNYILDGDIPLHRAVERGHQEIIEFLLDIGADVNIRDETESTPLITAACRGNREIANMLIAKGADINARDDNGYTPLIIAAKFGNTEVAGALILAGADIDAKDNNGNTALMYASIDDYNAIEPLPELEELAEISLREADKFKKLEKLDNILSNFEIKGRANIAIMLRIAGASQQDLGLIYLIKAAAEGNITKVENLIKTGIDVNSFNSYGQTALIAAAINNNINVVAALIEAGADVNLRKYRDDNTALIEAASRGHDEILRMLIKAGADVNLHTKYANTALIQSQYRGNPEIIQLLRDSGAKQYREIPVSQWRGIDSINLNDHCVIVKAPIEKVSQALYQIRAANIWQKDVFEKEIEITNICFTVFQFPGHSWTVIRDQNITISYSSLNPELIKKQWQHQINKNDAKAISQLLQTQAIYFICSDTADTICYEIFDNGEPVEEFYFCETPNFYGKDKIPAKKNECVIVTNTFNFRSKLRYITIDEIPQHEPDEEDYFAEQPDVEIDAFQFVNELLKSLDAYIPTWRGGRFYQAGQRITLRVIGFDSEDIERMDSIAIT